MFSARPAHDWPSSRASRTRAQARWRRVRRARPQVLRQGRLSGRSAGTLGGLECGAPTGPDCDEVDGELRIGTFHSRRRVHRWSCGRFGRENPLVAGAGRQLATRSGPRLGAAIQLRDVVVAEGQQFFDRSVPTWRRIGSRQRSAPIGRPADVQRRSGRRPSSRSVPSSLGFRSWDVDVDHAPRRGLRWLLRSPTDQGDGDPVRRHQVRSVSATEWSMPGMPNAKYPTTPSARAASPTTSGVALRAVGGLLLVERMSCTYDIVS